MNASSLFQPKLLVAIAAMVGVVLASNYLVQFPVDLVVAGFSLADLFTWGAFSYPLAFLVTDLTNRRFGASRARVVVLSGFALAVLLSLWLATPRIAIASGSAFLIAQLLDVSLFNRLRFSSVWWKAPVVSSVTASVVDTALFFTLAFAAGLSVLGPNDGFAIETAPLFAFGVEAPRWMSWALGDLAVKVLAVAFLLVPYRLLTGFIREAGSPKPGEAAA
uniref:VUT family protein n=1 Tax=Pararhizobium sp. IMCC3301 TaxID=3067904 RepID=UPI00274174E9|nr:VUT family protein [Pararhizobium sp. IMCC3301]